MNREVQLANVQKEAFELFSRKNKDYGILLRLLVPSVIVRMEIRSNGLFLFPIMVLQWLIMNL